MIYTSDVSLGILWIIRSRLICRSVQCRVLLESARRHVSLPSCCSRTPIFLSWQFHAISKETYTTTSQVSIGILHCILIYNHLNPASSRCSYLIRESSRKTPSELGQFQWFPVTLPLKPTRHAAFLKFWATPSHHPKPRDLKPETNQLWGIMTNRKPTMIILIINHPFLDGIFHLDFP